MSPSSERGARTLEIDDCVGPGADRYNDGDVVCDADLRCARRRGGDRPGAEPPADGASHDPSNAGADGSSRRARAPGDGGTSGWNRALRADRGARRIGNREVSSRCPPRAVSTPGYLGVGRRAPPRAGRDGAASRLRRRRARGAARRVLACGRRRQLAHGRAALDVSGWCRGLACVCAAGDDRSRRLTPPSGRTRWMMG